MPVKTAKGKKKATGGKKGVKKKGGTKKKGGAKKGKKGKKASAKTKVAPPVADPLSYDAMLNAYYIAHGPVQFLETRGFKWEGGGTKKKKGKKK